MIEPPVKQSPVFNASSIITGKQVVLNVTDFRLQTEDAGDNGGSGVVVHLSVVESILVGSLLCRLSPPHFNPIEFAIVAAGDNASLSHFNLEKHWGKLNVIVFLFLPMTSLPAGC